MQVLCWQTPFSFLVSAYGWISLYVAIIVSSWQRSARMDSEEDFGNAVMKEHIMLYTVAAVAEK